MSGILTTVQVEDGITSELYGTIKHLGQLKPLHQAIGQTLLSSTIRRFSTQTDPAGNAWTKLSKATLKKRGPNAQALNASGRLRQSLNFRASSDQVEVGTNLIYGAVQQLGTAGLEGGAIQMPARMGTIYRRSSDLKAGREARFVKASKSDFASDHLIPAHSVTIPGRAYLGMSAADQKVILALVHKFAMGG
jgi:phage virion morphogenesis protein